ncbi:MAG: site-specific DNA-methyltransferase, partial [Bacteroidota bacterium]
SNWQMRLNDRNVKDGSDEHLSGEPEQIKAFRDTWELGVHSYLSYLRDRLLIAKELLTESGSCFVQISDENVHLVRNVMDEVFGSENFVSLICFTSTSGIPSNTLSRAGDYILWYSRDINTLKYRQLFSEKEISDMGHYNLVFDGKKVRRLNLSEKEDLANLPKHSKLATSQSLTSQGETSTDSIVKLEGNEFRPPQGQHWKTTVNGILSLYKKNRIIIQQKSLRYLRFADDFNVRSISNMWTDTVIGSQEKIYVVQTSKEIIKRCILMTTDPGDIVLDPTCGSGTAAYVAEQWGRKWITIDTSRIALNIAKQRLMTATYPYYLLYDELGGDIRQGFKYKTVPHITLKSLANDEPPGEEVLYDQPFEDKKKLRVSGPFTVETLQNYEPMNPEMLDSDKREEDSGFEERIFEHLKSAGVKNGIKNEHAKFIRVEKLADSYLHAEGFYNSGSGERKAYLHIGPKFGTVSKMQVNEAIKSCRQRGDGDWLIILGFSFESDISNQSITTSMGSFEVTKVRMHDDLMQDGLLKKDKKAASFVTIGEPDVKLHKKGNEATVEICGLDIYDPIRDVVNARNVEDIAYWMVDTDYDGSNFVVRQVFFCGGSKDEFNKWRKGLNNLAKQKTKREAELTLKIEIDDEAFDRLYGFESHSFEIKSGQKIAVRVVSQFGEESTKVITI